MNQFDVFENVVKASRAVFPLVAQQVSTGFDPMAVLASGLVALSVYLFVVVIANTLASEDPTQDDEWRYDVGRINELRRISPFYRMLQPAIQALARFNRGAFQNQLPDIGREIQWPRPCSISQTCLSWTSQWKGWILSSRSKSSV